MIFSDEMRKVVSHKDELKRNYLFGNYIDLGVIIETCSQFMFLFKL